MKTKEEIIALKEEVDALNKKLAELSDEELAVVTGGSESRVPSEYLESKSKVIGLGTSVPDPYHAQTGNESSYPEEFLNMIKHQRGYQTNSRLLTTADAMPKEI